jgi:hypothetical protein
VLDDRRREAMPSVGELIHAGSLPHGLAPLELRFRDNAVTPSMARSAISGRACRGARAAGPGTSSAPKLQRFPSGPCGATAGDLPGADDAIDGRLLRQLVIANRGKRVIAFTHKPVLPDSATATRNRCTIAAANTVGFTINLSANNPAEADRLVDLEIGPVVTILAHNYARRAIRHRAKTRPDEWAETIAQWYRRGGR